MRFNVILASILAFSAMLSCSCGAPKQMSNNSSDAFSVEEMVKNYDTHADDIQKALKYAADALNDHCGLQLVLNQNGISQFYVYNFMWLGTDNPKQLDLDRLMPVVGLTQEELDSLVQLIRNANCLSVELMKSDSQFAKVLYWENKACGYYYHIFYEPLSDSEMDELSKELNYCIPYRNNLFLEYNPKKETADATFPDRDVYMKELGLIN